MNANSMEETTRPTTGAPLKSNGWRGSGEPDGLGVVKNGSCGETTKLELSKGQIEVGKIEMIEPTLMRVEIKPPRVALIPPRVEVKQTKEAVVGVEEEPTGKGSKKETRNRLKEVKLLERDKETPTSTPGSTTSKCGTYSNNK